MEMQIPTINMDALSPLQKASVYHGLSVIHKAIGEYSKGVECDAYAIALEAGGVYVSHDQDGNVAITGSHERTGAFIAKRDCAGEVYPKPAPTGRRIGAYTSLGTMWVQM